MKTDLVLFHRLVNELGSSLPIDTDYPRYNIIQINEEKTRLELAVAGFKKEELTVTQEFETKNSTPYLVITGKTKSSEEVEKQLIYVTKGISSREFKRKFRIPEYTEISDVKLENGILSIELELKLPDEKKPKTFDIN